MRFVDECSTIDNRTMVRLLEKVNDDSLLVFAGDTYQIESIDFGNWFFYAKEILPQRSVAELNSTWRTQNRPIRELWDAVRSLEPLITEMLVIDGPFSENIGKNIFKRDSNDEVILCLNYDGKFGLNSINRYFQDANPSTETYDWSEWRYKVGDPVLFNESKRFPALYNNLKGRIVAIERDAHSISFTVDIPIVLTAIHVKNMDIGGFLEPKRVLLSVLLYMKPTRGRPVKIMRRPGKNLLFLSNWRMLYQYTKRKVWNTIL